MVLMSLQIVAFLVERLPKPPLKQYHRAVKSRIISIDFPHFALSLATVSISIALPQIPCLPYPRQHAESLLLVLAPEILTIPRLLLPRPNAHLRRRDDREQNRAQTPRHQRHPHPRHRFEHVVRTCHQSKAETLRYPPLCSSCGP